MTLPPAHPHIELSENDFMRQVTDLAAILGWQWVHFRPGQTTHGWRTPVQGPLGAGWPDLVLVRRDRILFVELKVKGRKVRPEQEVVLGILRGVGEVHAWWPQDFPEIETALR